MTISLETVNELERLEKAAYDMYITADLAPNAYADWHYALKACAHELIAAARKWVESERSFVEGIRQIPAPTEKIATLEARVKELKKLVEEAEPFMRGTICKRDPSCGCGSCLWLSRARAATEGK